MDEAQRSFVRAGVLKDSLSHIRDRLSTTPSVAIILGSGLGGFALRLKNRETIRVEHIPHYPQQSVVGHSGKLVVGEIGGRVVLAFQGRTHFYEVGDLGRVLYPVRIAHGLGIRTLLLTNAAGGINRLFRPADLMLITDQINFTSERVLIRRRSPIHRRRVYDEDLQSTIDLVSRELGIPLRRGVYCGVKGPSYETRAEVEMIRRLGGDAVGMSTVAEASVGAQLGMRVAGISCITNLATGIAPTTLSHSDVTKAAAKVRTRFSRLLEGIVSRF